MKAICINDKQWSAPPYLTLGQVYDIEEGTEPHDTELTVWVVNDKSMKVRLYARRFEVLVEEAANGWDTP